MLLGHISNQARIPQTDSADTWHLLSVLSNKNILITSVALAAIGGGVVGLSAPTLLLSVSCVYSVGLIANFQKQKNTLKAMGLRVKKFNESKNINVFKSRVKEIYREDIDFVTRNFSELQFSCRRKNGWITALALAALTANAGSFLIPEFILFSLHFICGVAISIIHEDSLSEIGTSYACMELIDDVIEGKVTKLNVTGKLS